MREKIKKRKYIWILIGCIALIALIFSLHIAETKKMYAENLKIFYDFQLDSIRNRIKESVTRTVNDIDIEKSIFYQQKDKDFQNMRVIMESIADKDNINKLTSLMRTSELSKLKTVIWSSSERKIIESIDPKLPPGMEITKKDFLKAVQLHRYHVVKEIEEKQYIAALYLTDEDVTNEIQAKIADKIRETKLEDEGYIWVNEILDYSGGEGYTKSIVQPNFPESEGHILPEVNTETYCTYPYSDELAAINNVGEAYFTYKYKNKESDEGRMKLSYVQLYPDYNWIIGTGIFIDELHEVIIDKGYEFADQLKIRTLLTAGTMFLLFIIAGVSGLVLIQYHEDREKLLIKEKKQLLKQHYRILENKYDKTNQILHDVKNHLICIFGLAEHRNYEQVLTYIQSMQEDIDKLGYIVISGNKVVDIILNDKLEMMKKEGIHFNYEIESVEFGFIELKDIVTILSNLLDNAIESCMLSEDKNILFKLYSFNDHFIVFKVTNSCDYEPIEKEDKIVSHKASKEYHGYGMSNIRRSAHKYEGNMTWNYDKYNKEFHVVVMLPKPIIK